MTDGLVSFGVIQDAELVHVDGVGLVTKFVAGDGWDSCYDPVTTTWNECYAPVTTTWAECA
jgi:hypothetical protein